ncbi:dioxygenase [Hyphodiscus hymeniophilus]|uniref:Dioxygenase n=1 Tax=Hyphodiscus hymeniophilus TaxID=353542 RepID=A0A9P7B0K6_9HELO|nr:dioxygenase [Hyphodiscus hymeniophilus]
MGSVENRLYDQEIHKIIIPEEVRQNGKATNEIIAEGISFLHRDGIVVLENAIDTAHLDTLNALLSKEALEIAQDPDHHFNFGKETRNMDQAPPPRKDLMFKDVWCNPFAAAILAGVLGPRPVVHYANGNTALKATGRQPVHSDCEFKHPNFLFAMVVNVNLVDTSSENGATEFWLGSHHCSTSAEHAGDATVEEMFEIKKEHIETRRKHSPPIQTTTKKGSLIIRDLRLWHAGMPNKTDDPRVMLAFVVEPAWYQGKGLVKLPKSVKELVESWDDELQFAADWVDEVDHKKIRSTDTSFDTDNIQLNKYREELLYRPAYIPATF